MVVDLVPFARQAQTEFLVLPVCNEKDPLVEAIEVVASSGLVEVPDDRSDRRVDLCVVDDSPARIVVAFNSMLATFALS